MAQNRDNIIKHSIKSLQLLYHANPCNHVLQVLPTTSLVYIVFPYSEPGVHISHYYIDVFLHTGGVFYNYKIQVCVYVIVHTWSAPHAHCVDYSYCTKFSSDGGYHAQIDHVHAHLSY